VNHPLIGILCPPRLVGHVKHLGLPLRPQAFLDVAQIMELSSHLQSRYQSTGVFRSRFVVAGLANCHHKMKYSSNYLERIKHSKGKKNACFF
jgi:hypothetical protein